MLNLCGQWRKIRGHIFLGSDGIFVCMSCSGRQLPGVSKVTVTFRCIFTIRSATSLAYEPFSLNWKNLLG